MFSGINETDGTNIYGDEFSYREIYEIKGEVRQLRIKVGLRVCFVEKPLECTGQLTEYDLDRVRK